MTTMTPAIRWSVPARAVHATEWTWLGAAAAAEVLAAALLLFGGALPWPMAWPVAVISHVTAAWVVAAMGPAQPERRWLAGAAVLTVPIAGVAIAAAALSTRGRGLAHALHRTRANHRPRITVAAMRHLAEALSSCDALASGDADQRRSALSGLARREDPEAIALLRRAVAGRDPDLALSAALALDEIGERTERRAAPIGSLESSRVAG